MVISGGNFKPDTLKPKEVVSLLLDDDEIGTKCKRSIERYSSGVVVGRVVVESKLLVFYEWN